MGISRTFVACFVLGVPAVASADPDHVRLCHLEGDTGRYHAIGVSPNAVPAHLDNHGDFEAGAWYEDKDGDGVGGGEAVSECPEEGLDSWGGDCDDTDASVRPWATEVCNNEVDDDCDGSVDEGCCPCFIEREVCYDFLAGMRAAPAGTFGIRPIWATSGSMPVPPAQFTAGYRVGDEFVLWSYYEVQADSCESDGVTRTLTDSTQALACVHALTGALGGLSFSNCAAYPAP